MFDMTVEADADALFPLFEALRKQIEERSRLKATRMTRSGTFAARHWSPFKHRRTT